MWRNFDWQCTECTAEHEELIEYPQGTTPPRSIRFFCRRCGDDTLHDRLLSIPAPYMGERVYNPMVSGGAFDTTGHAPLPELPQMQTEHGAPIEASGGHYDVKEWTGALGEHFRSKEFREAKRARAEVKKQNAAKRERARLIKSGANINMRHDKLPGDPAITA